MTKTAVKTKPAQKEKTKKNSQMREVWDRLRHRPTAMIALFGVALMLFLAIFADLLVP